jgi:hypothetical protein
MEDEQVRQALDRGCDRRTIADVLGVSRRTTFNKEKRAQAYGFPLDAYYNRGGRPTTAATDSGAATDTAPGTETDPETTPDRGEPTGDADAAAVASDAQQRLDAVGGDTSDAAPTKAAAADAAGDDEVGSDADVESEVRATIEALEAFVDTLE